jgi:hypothetical protein
VLRIQTADGQTVQVDLNDAEQAKRLLSVVHADRLPENVTGLVMASPIEAQQVQVAVSIPKGFRNVEFGEAIWSPPQGRSKGYERLVLFCDDIQIAALIHSESPAVRLSVERVGFRRHPPKT